MNPNDSRIVSTIISLPAGMRLPVFWELYSSIVDDSTYWSALACIWMGEEVTTINLPYWIALFSSSRPNRHKMMKKADRQVWRKLPAKVKAYRAVLDPAEAEFAISWTLNKSVAELFFISREKKQIITREFQKEQIIAYFNRRQEHEIIVLTEVI